MVNNKEEIENSKIIKNELMNKKNEIINMQRDIYKICEDPLLIDDFLLDYEKRLFNMEYHKNNPYFARIKFTETLDNSKSDIYIGKLGYYKINDDISMVDWRSPVCDLYYNSAVGKSKYRVEDTIVDANLDLKRQINFEDGEVTDIFDFDKEISNDELLKPYLTKHADTRLKNIVSTIQQEQNEIIRYAFNKNIVVQGVAGSGKTTVALHRLSYLIYNYKKRYRPYQYLILSPNNVFIDYVSSILPELDAQDVINTSLEKLLLDITKMQVKISNKNEQHDFLLKNKISSDYLTFKSSSEFIRIIDEYIKDYEEKNFLKPLTINGIEILESCKLKEIYNQISANNTEQKFDLFCKRVAMSIRNNFDLRYEILSNLYKEHKITISQKSELNKILEKGCEKFVRKNFSCKVNFYALYKDFIRNIEKYSNYKDIEILKTQTLSNINKKILSYDDIGAVLYLYGSMKTPTELYADIRNIFIDEAQDLSIVIYCALAKIFNQSYFSIFGDLAQGMYSYQSITKWSEIDSVLDRINHLLLDKSYRTTIEIMENANETLKKLDMPLAQNVIRHGEKVDICIIHKKEYDDVVEEKINQLKNSGYKTIAVIFKNNLELQNFNKNNNIVDVTKIDENTTSYNSQIVALTVKTAKGLEFDAVIIYNENSYKDSISIDLKELFVAKTRALHKLVILK